MFLFFLSLVLIYLSYPNIFFLQGSWFCAWIFAVPLFFLLEVKKSFWQRFFGGLFYGLCFYGMLVHWFVSYSFWGYLLFVLVLSIQPLLFFLFYPAAHEKILWKILYVPALWVLSEYARTMAMSGFSWGLAHSQAFNLYFIQTANLFGQTSVAFLVMGINYGFFEFLVQKRKRTLILVLAVIAAVYAYGFWSVRDFDEKTAKAPVLRVGLIEPHINSREKLDDKHVERIFDAQILLTESLLAEGKPDFIVWPETALPFDILKDERVAERLNALTEKMNIPLLVGAALADGKRIYNSAVLFLPGAREKQVYYKRHLVPFSEYVPGGAVGQWVAKTLNMKTWGFDAGQKSQLFHFRPTLWGGPLICSEELLGFLSRQNAVEGALFNVILLNDGWFESSQALILHGQGGILSAVENLRPVVRSTNTGWSVVIDAAGRYSPRDVVFSKKGRWYLETFVPFGQPAMYSRLGDIFPFFCACFVIINWFVFSFLRKRRSP